MAAGAVNLWRWIPLLGGIVALAVLFAQLGPGQVATLLTSIGPNILVIVALFASHECLRALCLSRCLPPSHRPSFRRLLRIRFLGGAQATGRQMTALFSPLTRCCYGCGATIQRVYTRSFLRCGIVSVVVLVSILSAACKRGVSGAPIRIDGSSTLYPLTAAVGEQFKVNNPNAVLDVKFSGTDAGFATFCKGELDIQDASRPIEAAEIDACRRANVHFVELPVAYDGLTVIVHPSNTWADAITVRELKTLWEPAAAGKVTRWSQVRAGWPDRPIALLGPGSSSGTFDFFTLVIVGDERSSRTDYWASEDDEKIVKGVAAEPGALAYVGYSYYERNRASVKALGIDDLDDSIGRGPVEPSADNVRRGLYRPLTRPLFIYVNTDRMTRPEVKAFVDFYVRQGPALAARFEIPLNPQLYNIVQQRAIQRVEGSLYERPEAKDRTLDQLLNQ